MVNTRKQLFIAIAMLLVAALALGTSTYAWFVANQNTAIEQMNFTAETADAVQIALSTEAWDGDFAGTNAEAGGFKSLIKKSDIETLYTSKTAVFAGPMTPASTVNCESFYKAKTWNEDGTLVDTFEEVNHISSKTVKAIPLFFRSNANKTVMLSSQSAITGDAAAAVRIAVIPADGSNKLLWAPVNSDTHVTESGITSLGNADGINTAINATDATAAISPTVTQGAQLAADTTVVKLTSESMTTPKMVMVYIWLEGCDVDCVSTLSTAKLDVSLKFTAQ